MSRRWARRPLIAFPLLLALATPARAAGTEDEALPVNRLVGQRVANFTLKDVTTGKDVSLYDYRGKRAVVLAFLGTDCPVGDLYAPRLAELGRAFKDRGVAFVGVNANAHETAADVATYVKTHGLDFPVLKDEGNVIADALLVERTPEVVVLDGLAFVRYRGAVDDQYGVGTRKPEPARHYLRDALEEIVTGGRVEPKGTAVAGCLIDRVAPKPSRSAADDPSRVRRPPPEVAEVLRARDEAEEGRIGPVTYAGGVAAIVQNKCQSCHRPGEVGPFPLLTYDDLRKHAAMVREVVDERRMPPWHADPRVGHFANDRSLTPRERAALIAWVDQGAPLGDPKAVPAPRSFPDGWTIGTPDLVFEVPEPYVVPAQGTVEYIRVRVPTQFKEDVWVRAAEARPGNRSVVHHIIVYVFDRGAVLGGGRGRGADARADAHLCGYAPGDMPTVYPEGTAKKIPAGSDLLFEIHYTPNGKVRTDRPRVGLILAKGPVTRRAHTRGIANPEFEIPPGAAAHKVTSSFTFSKDAELHSFMPHMHLRGKSFRYTARYPDGRTEELLSVPAYDFGWQSYYTLAAPKPMPRGTRIDCEARFDNSDGNPSNPDPTKPVRWGEQTWQEMMIGYIDYTDAASPDPAPKAEATAPTPGPSSLVRTLRALGAAAQRQKAAQDRASR